ncbi:MAG: histidine phosphatase family protein [Bacteroidetes bacterium]|nr:histidine phosphatase family protein [Bacteroidota bacterium]
MQQLKSPVLFILPFLFLACTESLPEAPTSDCTITTYYLMRHAEKDTIPKDPDLSEVGVQRAQLLQEMFAQNELNAIYSTDYKRTMQTVQWIASHHQLDIRKYDPTERAAFIQGLRVNHTGQKVLIVGHSNTIPALLNYLTETTEYSTFPDHDYNDLFIVTEAGNVVDVTHLEYGNQ